MTTPDYSADIAGPTATQFERLNNLAQQLHGAELGVARAEEALAKAKERVVDISEHQLVELMEEMGLEDFTTSSGFKAKLGTKIFASIPKSKLTEALKWLDDHNEGGLIKTQLIAKFSRGKIHDARKLANDLITQGIDASASEAVHPQTLGAWARRQLEEGIDIPLDLFGVHRRRSVKVST